VGGDAGLAQSGDLLQLVDGQFILLEQGEDAQAGGISQGAEGTQGWWHIFGASGKYLLTGRVFVISSNPDTSIWDWRKRRQPIETWATVTSSPPSPSAKATRTKSVTRFPMPSWTPAWPRTDSAASRAKPTPSPTSSSWAVKSPPRRSSISWRSPARRSARSATWTTTTCSTRTRCSWTCTW